MQSQSQEAATGDPQVKAPQTLPEAKPRAAWAADTELSSPGRHLSRNWTGQCKDNPWAQ